MIDLVRFDHVYTINLGYVNNRRVIKMRAQDRDKARKALDKRLNSLRNPEGLAMPPRGWIKAIREALGMTTRQFARRMGISQPRAVAIEKAEPEQSITLATLERAAHALDCQLVYALVPRHSLEQTIKDRALDVARRRLISTSHSMTLEDQAVDEQGQRAQIARLAEKLIAQPGSKLWEEE
jgi:predicted DNA-binding mobile mystery protein A